ncbi:hypothetical protein Pla22_33670 [Rubripirellula amarantea]|uniref:Uncharacterized protein n=1 Tax=Rubripirellula amarantea TaxID=2527999 RepID=A0A5C5WIH6_9BACT|nr:hypothetical protein [Rubripirellula amarantea]TWT50624.1 hypothetical protein Pla22_33670 [Rubripirellula amarantea]
MNAHIRGAATVVSSAVVSSTFVTATVVLVAVAVMATDASAQVVQRPSIETFTYSGSVLVPDQGSTYLGGVSRASTSSSRRGLNHRFGGAMSHHGAAVSATIIDLDAMDRAIRGTDSSAVVQIDPSSRAAKTQRGKALVRLARRQYRDGQQGESFQTYRIAITMLDGNLQDLATKEFRRVFGVAATQVR